MTFIAVFWFLFLIDSIIVLFSFIIFVCIWMSLFFILAIFFVVEINSKNSNSYNYFIYWDFIGSKYVDFYWFVLGTFFVIGLLSRLCLLLYFGSANFLCFDLCKVIGFQWYWIYQTSSNNSNFSNLVLESDYFIGDLRLLQTNHVLTLLSLVVYKLWLTSIDVIHSFTISSLGVKVDCIPGRCNELTLLSSNEGCFYGQCSELCGVLHGFMPICIQFI